MTSEIFQGDFGNTELSPEERLELIPSLTTRAELNEIERLNINGARVWAMRRPVLHRPDLLTDGFARELHRRMFNQVWRWAGRYRTTEKNLGWEVHRIAEGVRNAFDDAKCWMQFSTYPLDEAAVRLHHRLFAIHPWPNGNGRHARLIADILIASRGGAELTWGAHSDLVAVSEARGRYIAAIHIADAGDFAPLLAFARG
jgi:Fic-DOC domain mobile mystery protein B